MGIPTIIADGEAEALCVALCREGVVDAVASADLDCVAYGAPVFIRNLATDKPCIEIRYDRVLEELKFTTEQFTDLCLLLGCDYVPGIAGVGPKTAFTAMKKHGCIEKVLENPKIAPENPADYLKKVVGARQIFATENTLSAELKAKYQQVIGAKMPINIEGAVEFLAGEMQFGRENATQKLEKFQKAKKAPKQMSLAGFIKKVDKE